MVYREHYIGVRSLFYHSTTYKNNLASVVSYLSNEIKLMIFKVSSVLKKLIMLIGINTLKF